MKKKKSNWVLVKPTKEDRLQEKYWSECIDGIDQHKDGLTFEEWKKRRP